MSARDDIYRNIRRSLGVTGAEAIRRRIVSERIASAPRGVVPARGQVSGEELTALFRTQAELALATVAEVASAAEVPRTVAEYLRNHNLPAAIRIGEDERLTGLSWDATGLAVSRGRSQGGDLNAVSHAFAAVAESGTLVLLSGPENPTTLNFLPDNHIVILQAKDLAGDYESVWSRLRSVYGKGLMPRTVNWITGPSRSGDIEQTMILGAHGPRRLHVVLVKDSAAGP
jgi:L-lactate dehydrogenase complex protein LldG